MHIDPAYAPMILKEAQSMISHLKSLDKADCLFFDVSVNTAPTPPVVDVNAVTEYDAVETYVFGKGIRQIPSLKPRLDTK